MQQFLKWVRWIVGLLFIFSGIIKANDPLGLSYKMQEFFDVWGMSFANDYTLVLSLIMNTLEIVTGIALIIKYPYKQTLWVLLSLILFFSFLTGYALFSGKIKTCGCFGDCIPLTPRTSFIKDIVLLIAILLLLFQQKKVQTKLHPFAGILLLVFTSTGVVYGQLYVLKHLPFVDCLPYKEGKDIMEQMKVPTNAIADSVSIQLEYSKLGKTQIFDANQFPADFDSTYQYIGRKEIIIRKGNGITAAIQDFKLETLTGEDSTSAIFNNTRPYVLVFAGMIDQSISWDAFLDALHKKYALVYIVTADKSNASRLFSKESVLIADITLIKTAARVWPTIFVMNGSTIMQKTAFIDFMFK